MFRWSSLAETTIVWRRRAAMRQALRRHLLDRLSSAGGEQRFVSPPALIREAGKPFWRA